MASGSGYDGVMRQENVPKVGLIWGIGGQRVRCLMRECSMMGMKV